MLPRNIGFPPVWSLTFQSCEMALVENYHEPETAYRVFEVFRAVSKSGVLKGKVKALYNGLLIRALASSSVIQILATDSNDVFVLRNLQG